MSADDAIKARTLSLFHSAPIGPLAVPEANSMALVDFVSPGRWGLRVSQTGTEQLQYAIYPGLIVLVLAGLAVRTRQPWTRSLLLGAFVMAMLAMGPRIYLDHGRSIGGVPNPIYLLAYWVIPLVNATIHSVDRFAIGLQLCLALLAALGLSQVRATLRPWLILGVFAELLLISPGPWPLPTTANAPPPASTNQPTPPAVTSRPSQAMSQSSTGLSRLTAPKAAGSSATSSCSRHSTDGRSHTNSRAEASRPPAGVWLRTLSSIASPRA